MKILAYLLFFVATCSVSFSAGKPLKMPNTVSAQGIEVVLEGLSTYAQKWNLSTSYIQSKVEQTLMRFNLEPSDDEPMIKGYLYVNVNIVNIAYNITICYKRPLWDSDADRTLYLTGTNSIHANVWDRGILGINGSYDKSKVLSAVNELVEEFCTDYIKQNRKPATK